VCSSDLINSFYNLQGDEMFDKRHPVIEMLKNWVDEEYHLGRITVISDDELQEKFEEHMKNREA
jgi:hypothetical protein